MKQLSLKIILNNTNWPSIGQKIDTVGFFYASKIALTIDVVNSSFVNIPFVPVAGLDGTSGTDKVIQTEAVDPIWYDQNITANSLSYDMVLFYVPGKDKIGHVTSTGIRGDNAQGPVELTLFGMNEHDHAYQNGADLGDCFSVFACHEVAHALFLLFGGVDETHKYFYSTNPAGILADFNFTEPVITQSHINSLQRAVAYLKMLYQKIMNTPQPQQFPAKIIAWAKAIASREGANPALNNPGNFKLTSLIASWGGTLGPAGSDGGNFALFSSYAQGFTALCNFLVLGAEDELKAYHNARTIKEFTEVYTNHPKPEYDYSDSLIKELGVTADTNVATFLVDINT